MRTVDTDQILKINGSASGFCRACRRTSHTHYTPIKYLGNIRNARKVGRWGKESARERERARERASERKRESGREKEGKQKREREREREREKRG